MDVWRQLSIGARAWYHKTVFIPFSSWWNDLQFLYNIQTHVYIWCPFVGLGTSCIHDRAVSADDNGYLFGMIYSICAEYIPRYVSIPVKYYTMCANRTLCARGNLGVFLSLSFLYWSRHNAVFVLFIYLFVLFFLHCIKYSTYFLCLRRKKT